MARCAYNAGHSTARATRLKFFQGLVLLAWTICPAPAQTPASAPAPPDVAALREELTRLLQAGKPEQAIRRAQEALRKDLKNPTVRQEFAALHYSLARTWLAQRRYEDCLTALKAVQTVEPDHPAAAALREQVQTAREQAAQRIGEAEKLLRLELFEAALDRLMEIQALRPDLSPKLETMQRAAWLGAADDHYLARNFNEAFALYEHVLATTPNAPADVALRWAISLALALDESEAAKSTSAETVRKLSARATEVLVKVNESTLVVVLNGLLAEKSGQLADAGRLYAQAVGAEWQLPPAERRREAVAQLRRQAVESVRNLCLATPPGRRGGQWAAALPNVWKQRKTARFDVYARNDLVAGYVSEALEHHYAGLAQWLELSPAAAWEPRCEVRVHATLADLYQATNTRGATRAVSRTRLQGGNVLSRHIEVFQADPWLLCSTLPHELTHILLADKYRAATLPLALDEGLALQAEPPARRLQFRRRLNGPAPDAAKLLAATEIPAAASADEGTVDFYARCDALTEWLLQKRGMAGLLEHLGNGAPPRWWEAFGWARKDDMQSAWRSWFAGRRDPPRMPLMVLGEPRGKR